MPSGSPRYCFGGGVRSRIVPKGCEYIAAPPVSGTGGGGTGGGVTAPGAAPVEGSGAGGNPLSGVGVCIGTGDGKSGVTCREFAVRIGGEAASAGGDIVSIAPNRA